MYSNPYCCAVNVLCLHVYACWQVVPVDTAGSWENLVQLELYAGTDEVGWCPPSLPPGHHVIDTYKWPSWARSAVTEPLLPDCQRFVISLPAVPWFHSAERTFNTSNLCVTLWPDGLLSPFFSKCSLPPPDAQSVQCLYFLSPSFLTWASPCPLISKTLF